MSGEISGEVKALIIIGAVVLVLLLAFCPKMCCRGLGSLCGCSLSQKREHVEDLNSIEVQDYSKPTAPQDDKGYYASNLTDFKDPELYPKVNGTL